MNNNYHELAKEPLHTLPIHDFFLYTQSNCSYIDLIITWKQNANQFKLLG